MENKINIHPHHVPPDALNQTISKIPMPIFNKPTRTQVRALQRKRAGVNPPAKMRRMIQYEIKDNRNPAAPMAFVTLNAEKSIFLYIAILDTLFSDDKIQSLRDQLAILLRVVTLS